MEADLALLHNEFEDVFCTEREIQLRAPFRLFDLPPELWLRVCEFAVIRPSTIRVGKEPSLVDQVAITRQPAITRTCRLLRHESLPLFYSSNTFEMLHCSGVPCPRNWIKAIGSDHRRRMKSMLMSEFEKSAFAYNFADLPFLSSPESSCDLGFWEGSYRRAAIDAEVEFLSHEANPVALYTGFNRFKVSFS